MPVGNIERDKAIVKRRLTGRRGCVRFSWLSSFTGVSGIKAIVITVNGEIREMPVGATVSDLLACLQTPQGAIAIEVNREIITRSRHSECVLSDGDEVEILTFVGGG